MHARPVPSARLAALVLLLLSTAPLGSTQPTAPQESSGAAEPLGFGTLALPTEIAAVDYDVRPDGTGLPPGSGSVTEGQQVYARSCVGCHGPTGVEGPNDKLVSQLPPGEFPFGRQPRQPRTIGDYWPYPTTLFDYIKRAMPLNAPGSMTDSEVYSLTAYLLHLNRLLPQDAVVNADTLPQVNMPARHRFVPAAEDSIQIRK